MPAKKRELIDTGTDKRYIRRDDEGQFTTDQVDVGRSLAADQRQDSKTKAGPGQAIGVTAQRSESQCEPGEARRPSRSARSRLVLSITDGAR